VTIGRRRVSTSALEFELLEAGSGPLALCLHGFPDTAHSWRHLLPVLADAGFHSVAPFMRGYHPTEIPKDGQYRLDSLVGDVNELHEALGGDSEAVLIGHDWGAVAAYAAAPGAGGRWRRLVTLAIPPLELNPLLFSDYAQIKRFFYMFVFQVPFAEELVAAGDMAFIARLWEDWSPGYDPSEDLVWVRESLARRENLSAALGYYRALFAALQGGGLAPLGQAEQPTLYVHGARDGCVGLELVRDAEQYLAPGSRMIVLKEAGHFLHLEQPDDVARLILEFVAAG
jgi:pimeloyl-ACP methyl ester carboxylesterase